MEILLLVKLIEKLDGLTQKSIGRAIGDFERFPRTSSTPSSTLMRPTLSNRWI